jgi:hypothetical protein
MPRKPTKKLIATFDLRKTFGTYSKLERKLQEAGIKYSKTEGTYGGGGRIYFDFLEEKIVITSYLGASSFLELRDGRVVGSKPAFIHYMITPTRENISKLEKLLNLKIEIPAQHQ